MADKKEDESVVKIKVKGTILELVIADMEYIPLVSKNRHKDIRQKIDEIVTIDEQNLEGEILHTAVKLSELHDLIQNESELLFSYKNMLKRVENIHSRYFKRQLSDRHYAKYGRQNETLSVADVKMAIEMQPDVKLLTLSIDRLSRILKLLEDQISVMQYSYTKSIGDSIRMRIFLEGSGM